MRRTAAVLSSVALATAGFFAATVPASATTAPSSSFGQTSPYVALGDSYSSGAGVHPLVAAAPLCSRSWLNYAHDIAAVTRPRSFTDVTCSGAATADFFNSQAGTGAPPQLDAVTKDTRLVTMTIGGNDGNLFSSMLEYCATASAVSLATTGSIEGNPCQQLHGQEIAGEMSQTYGNLLGALTAVRQKAPDATVVILGYPRILPDTGVRTCYPAMPFSMGDVTYMNDVEAQLNGIVEQAAEQTGARFVDMAPSSAGHDACRGPLRRWVEPLIGPINAFPVHPNAFGEAAMAAQTLLQAVR